jgi:hypothetical protein
VRVTVRFVPPQQAVRVEWELGLGLPVQEGLAEGSVLELVRRVGTMMAAVEMAVQVPGFPHLGRMTPRDDLFQGVAAAQMVGAEQV